MAFSTMTPTPLHNVPPGPSGAALLLVGVITRRARGWRCRDGDRGAAHPATSWLSTGADRDPQPCADQRHDRVGHDRRRSSATSCPRCHSGEPHRERSAAIERLRILIDAQQGYVATNNHVVENLRGGGAGSSFDVIFPTTAR